MGRAKSAKAKSKSASSKPKTRKIKTRTSPAKRGTRSSRPAKAKAKKARAGARVPVDERVVDDAIGRMGQGGDAQRPAPRPEIPRVLNFAILKNYPRERQFIIRKPMQKSLVDSLRAVLGKR